MANNDTLPAQPTQKRKWNLRYQQAQAVNQPARVLTDNRHLWPRDGDALELACGLGGNALALAHAGLRTQAWDLSDVAIDKLQRLAEQQHLPLIARCVDLQQQPLPTASFELICVSNFLDRALCPAIVAALRPGGLLFYQTFTQPVTPDSGGPRTPDFLLKPGELLRLFSGLAPLVYQEMLYGNEPEPKPSNQAYLIARKE